MQLLHNANLLEQNLGPSDAKGRFSNGFWETLISLVRFKQTLKGRGITREVADARLGR